MLNTKKILIIGFFSKKITNFALKINKERNLHLDLISLCKIRYKFSYIQEQNGTTCKNKKTHFTIS